MSFSLSYQILSIGGISYQIITQKTSHHESSSMEILRLVKTEDEWKVHAHVAKVIMLVDEEPLFAKRIKMNFQKLLCRN